tara:strand:- start:1519 stop:2799 length:1281 start_codon:yes stop_codon:yes gene_type:complete
MKKIKTIDKPEKTCPEGKVINPITNRCIKKPLSKPEKTCPEGKVINPKTGRCINKVKILNKKVCPSDKIINPKTGRCINKPKCKLCNKYIYNTKYANRCYNCNINKKNDNKYNKYNINMNLNIINNLKILEEYERILGNNFKANAYGKVINNIELYSEEIKTKDDLKKIKGVGEKINEKIIEYLDTGEIKKIKDINEDETFKLNKKLSNIYGIGPKKIKELMSKISKYEELFDEKNSKLLNNKQKIGLKYQEDLEKRIPYNEGKEHNKLINNVIKLIDINIEFEIVGSYRRKNKDMGDIDILIKDTEGFKLNELIDKLKEKKYIIETLANGKNKFMGICKLSDIQSARRIDILVANESYYYFALLYFTGSYQFNILMRRKALEKGYSLSEYGLKDIKTDKLIELEVKSEEKIFEILDMKYVIPSNR